MDNVPSSNAPLTFNDLDAKPGPDDDNFASWIRANVLNIVIGAALLGVVLWKLHPMDVALAAAGLTLIIFLHELGHFTAAKLCKVRVEMFSIGFGPAIPFCKYKYGETTYKLAVIPLGGFVKMLGEGDNADAEGAEEDPRSFKNQSVPERMFIISAGVIMNMILAMVLFVVVYSHGLQEQPAVVADVEPGGAFWRHNVHTGSVIESIDGKTNLWFDDVRPLVWNTNTGDTLRIAIKDGEKTETLTVEPRFEPGAPFPLLGFRPPESLTLYNHPRDKTPPYKPGSAASKAEPAFVPGDKIVAMTDSKTNAVAPIEVMGDSFAVFEFQRRMAALTGKPMTVTIQRIGETTERSVTIPAEFRKESGLRMRMGPISAIRDNSPAANAGIKVKDAANEGDRIVEVETKATDGGVMVYAADTKEAESVRKEIKNLTVKPLDPLRLPWLLHAWAQASTGTVKVTVLRSIDHSEKRVTLELPWDKIGAADLGEVGSATTPQPINGLGLAYQVLAVIDAVEPKSSAAEAGLQPGDTVEAVKFVTLDDDGKASSSNWQDVKPHQWAFVDRVLQNAAPHELELKVNRGGEKLEKKITAVVDSTCPVIDRGLLFMPDYRIQKAANIGEALGMGVNRTVRMVKTMYINLYAMVFGRVSAIQTMSGPITLGRLAYRIAGESTYKLLLLLALISINLAVVNFLPIPVLDGGHMMFLVYEGLTGKPPPERVHFYLSMLGLACVLSLMAFVIGLDIWRLVKVYFGW
ncbi:site-2 protease family protein [soil metagenome]